MKLPRSPAAHPDRRDFLKRVAGTGLIAGVGPLLAACGGGGGDGDGDADGPGPKATLQRSYFFDFSGAHPEAEHFLVAGTTHHKLARATPPMLQAAAGTGALPAGTVTHAGVGLPLPAAVQICYVKSVPPPGARADGGWDMHSMFYHVPPAAAAAAGRAIQSCGKAAPASLRGAYAEACRAEAPAEHLAQVRSALAVANSYCTGPDYDDYKDYFDQAIALVCNHPEIGSFDGATLAYVQQAIVCADVNLLELAVSLYEQGPAQTTPGGWATLVPWVDPDTGLVKLGSDKLPLYFTQYSPTTLKMVGAAIASVLPKVKNDPMLGASITGLDKSQVNSGLQGKMWVTRQGTPTRQAAGGGAPALKSGAPSLAMAAASASSAPSWAARDLSGGSGFSVNSIDSSDRTITFTCSNWYLRYLGVYVRFLDGSGRPIPRSSLPADTQSQFISGVSGTYDCFMSLLNQELVILGIPVRQASEEFTVVVPQSAASIQILAGGLGSGSNSYPDTVTAGAVMTVVLDLAIPGLFLSMAACTAYAGFCGQMSASSALLVSTAQILILALADTGLSQTYDNPEVFMNLVLPIATTLLKSAKALYAVVQENIAEGEAEGAAEDAIPFGIGLIIQAVMALGTAAQIAETSAEVANAPWTFVTEVNATHDLQVTIHHDPLDTQGFPATATHYRLMAVCDGGSPTMSEVIAMPPTTQTDPLAYTFRGLPSGGKVTVTVAFYSGTEWLAGAGSSGVVDNTQDAISITIVENLVPLLASTVYSHKQKIVRNAAGEHVWMAAAQPPATPLACNNVPGNLCILQSIAVSETFGAVGYAWQAYSAGVRDFATGAAGQLYQFANISFTQHPQRGWMHSGGGFTSPPRVAYTLSSPGSQAYYLDTSGGAPLVRRITMTAVDVPPTFDAPRSGRAVGRFNFPSDAFLVHPAGKLVSINASLGKLEVLVPSDVAVADASAPVAQAYAGPGTREGLLDGPVCAVIAPGGAILVLEQAGNRVQAFDTGANPAPFFSGASTMALKPQTGQIQYLDMAMEFAGFLYVLSVNNTTGVRAMDIYTPQGRLLATTTGMNAGKLAIDLFRNVFTLNYETILPVGSITEPSVSQWIPSTP